jgi:ABC-type transporter Mla MlaB component
MLKITMTETAAERRWVLEGCLAGPWVTELWTTWSRTLDSHDKRTCVINLDDVTFIDKGGEQLLRVLSKSGAQLVSRGVYTRHVLEQLTKFVDAAGGARATNSSTDRAAIAEDL